MEGSWNKQSGFSAVEGVVAVLVVVVLAAASWAVYQRVKTSATTTKAASNPNTQQTPTTTQPAPTVAYLTIKEWGIKLPLSDSIKDAYYVISNASWRNPDGLPSTAWIGLKSFTSTSCDPSNNDKGSRGAIGAILRLPPTQTDGVTGQLLTQKYPNGTTIGGYYYAYQSWATGNPCASQTTLQPADSAFASAAKDQITAAAN